MKSDSKISLLFPLDIDAQGLGPSFEGLRQQVVNIDKRVIIGSLKKFVNEIKDIIGELPTSSDRAILDEISVVVEFTREGGVAWVASANASLTHAMELKFKVRHT